MSLKYIGKNILNHTLEVKKGDISGSAASTGSFGHIKVGGGNFTSASLAAGGGASSYTDLTNVPSGIISGSEQLPNGIISGSAQLPTGVVSGSGQITSVITDTYISSSAAGSGFGSGGGGGSSFSDGTAALVSGSSVSTASFGSGGVKVIDGDVETQVITRDWDLSTVSLDKYMQDGAVSDEWGDGWGITASPDGKNVYVSLIGSSGDLPDSIAQYALSSSFDIGSRTLHGSKDVSSQGSLHRDLTFSPDGLKLITIETQNSKYNEYNLTKPWDITTLTYVQNATLQGSSQQGITARPDGLKLYQIGENDSVLELTMTSPWDVSTISLTSTTSVSGDGGTEHADIFFRPDGRFAYLFDKGGKKLYKWKLSTPWVFSTATYTGENVAMSNNIKVWGNSEGTRLFGLDYGNERINQYSWNGGPTPHQTSSIDIIGKTGISGDTIIYQNLDVHGKVKGYDAEFKGNVSGSSTSTGSFGYLVGDGGGLTNISAGGAAGTVSSSAQLSAAGFGNISGSAASTGSFGELIVVDNATIDGNISGSVGTTATLATASIDNLTTNTSDLVLVEEGAVTPSLVGQATGNTIPSGIQADDVIILVHGARSNYSEGTNIANAGYTLIGENVGNGAYAFVAAWYKVADGSESTIPDTWGIDTQQSYAFRGLDTSSPIDAGPNYTDGGLDPGSITTANNNAIVIIATGVGTTGYINGASPTGYSTRQGNAVTNQGASNTAFKIVATAGSEDPGDWGTMSSEHSKWAHMIFSLKPGGSTNRGYDDIKNVGASNYSGSATSTGSFGHLMVGGGDFTSASLAAGVTPDDTSWSDGTAATISGSAASTGSFGHIKVGGGNFTSASLAAGGGGEANEFSFKTIEVSGQSDVVADTTTDTLTLVAGSNMNITTTADQITFATTGGGSVTSADSASKVQNTHTSTNTNYAIPFLGSYFSGHHSLYTDNGNNITYNPSTNTLTATNFAGTATNATSASKITVAHNGDNANYALTFVESNVGGTYQPLTDSGNDLKYNPSTNTLTATNISGTATNATSASKITVAHTSTNANHAITFVENYIGNTYQPKTDSGNDLTYNPSTNTLNATNFAGTATNATSASKVTIGYTGTNQNYAMTFVESYIGGTQTLYADNGNNGPLYNPSTNTLTVGNLVGTVATATSASKLNTGYTGNNQNYAITFVENYLGGHQTLYADNGNNLLYNPSTNTLTAGTFSGTAVTATSASKVTTSTTSTNQNYAMTFVETYLSNTQTLYTDNANDGPLYNPGSNTLTATNLTLSGDLTVNGTTTTINSTAVSIGDRIIDIAGTATNDGGIYVRDASGGNATGSLLWDVSANRWIGGVKDSEANLVTISSTDTLTNKTLTAPTINGVVGGTATSQTITTLTSTTVKDFTSVSGSLTSTGSFGRLVAESRGIIGQAYIGDWEADHPNDNFAIFGNSNLDHTATGNYALLQQNNGETFLNAASGRSINFRINNSTVSQMTSTMAISGSAASTGSFGHLMVGGGNFTSASLAAGGGGGGGSGTGFPFTGSAGLSGSMDIIGSGSNIFTVDGTNGRLFSVSDEMSGSIFSANLVSGLPVIEAFSDNIVKIGKFSNPIIISGSGVISGSSTSTASFGHLMVGGGNFTSASLAAGGGGGGSGAVSAVANGSDNRIATFSSADALNGEANLTFDGSTLGVTGAITATGNVSSSNSSTGSFGHLEVGDHHTTGNNATTLNIKSNGQTSNLGFMEGATAGILFNYDGSNNKLNIYDSTLSGTRIATFFRANAAVDFSGAITGSHYSGSAASTGSFGHIMKGGVDFDTAVSSSAQAAGFGSGGGGGGGSGEANQNAFSTIAVSGQDNVVADSATDTLTLVAGSNMTLTTNASGDTVTFASSGGGGGGSGTNSGSYTFAQNGASTNWAITHSLGTQYNAITVYDESDNVVIPYSIVADDANKTTITFTEAITGKAVVNSGGTVGTVTQISTDGSHVHNQSGASTNWAITHSLNSQYPNVTVYDDNDEVVIPYSIKADSANLSTITFTEAVSGKAIYSMGGNLSGSAASTGSFGRVDVAGKLFVGGTQVNVPDYVFESEYELKTIDELETHISESKHLPGIPSRDDIEGWKNADMGSRDMMLLEKIEEMSLYIIELNKRLEKLENNS